MRNIQNINLKFCEADLKGYKQRTCQVIKASDVVIALAADFTTYGEIATLQTAKTYGKLYIPIDITKDICFTDTSKVRSLIIQYAKFKKKSSLILNIAGNGIYTLKKFGNQEMFDDLVSDFLNSVLDLSDMSIDKFVSMSIDKFVSGGQTGIDEAGIKAAYQYRIPNITVIAPKGWAFRDKDGKDIYDKDLFINRFAELVQPVV
ncbi:MAG: hypothetical protein HGB12_17015 [Bacteroidetes bacterium]|nr:hypothetical protein [Bacteroidota bacterium]